jgi:hypothetical protein
LEQVRGDGLYAQVVQACQEDEALRAQVAHAEEAAAAAEAGRVAEAARADQAERALADEQAINARLRVQLPATPAPSPRRATTTPSTNVNASEKRSNRRRSMCPPAAPEALTMPIVYDVIGRVLNYVQKRCEFDYGSCGRSAHGPCISHLFYTHSRRRPGPPPRGGGPHDLGRV